MPQIEERTISRVGGSSLMVTLPKSWCRFNKLNPGDKVLVVTNGEIRIAPKKRNRKTLGCFKKRRKEVAKSNR
jgi:antitoxin component of MazEF toxin-antitoxin module